MQILYVPVSLTVKLETLQHQAGTDWFWDSALCGGAGQSDASVFPAKGSVECGREGA